MLRPLPLALALLCSACPAREPPGGSTSGSTGDEPTGPSSSTSAAGGSSSTGDASTGGESTGSSSGAALTSGEASTSTGPSSSSSSGEPGPVCGDGVVGGAEACDDGKET